MECDSKDTKMVATLQSRKDAIEAKLREKTEELKKLCIQEAELTGILPPETPIEPGETLPTFRRHLGAAFSYPPNLATKPKSTEDEDVLAKLEMEYKVQTSISDATLVLANDLKASKSIRRKHRLEYQQSQRRLADLETRLGILRQSIRNANYLKHHKKHHSPIQPCSDCLDGNGLAPDDLVSHFNHMHDISSTLPTFNSDILRSNHFYNSFGKGCHAYSSSSYHHWNRNQHYRRSVERPHHNSAYYDENTNWLEDSDACKNTVPVAYFCNQYYTTLPADVTRVKSRYGSLDRRFRNSYYGGEDLPSMSSNQRNSPVVYAEVTHRLKSQDNPVLLPSQTYPENSLMRTQALNTMEPLKPCTGRDSLQEKTVETCQSGAFGRRTREKEWRETALDNEICEPVPGSPPSHTPPLHPRASKMLQETMVPQRPSSVRGIHTTPRPFLPPHCVVASSPPPLLDSKSPVKSPVLVETLPFESPKNHTVVEVGKWQPYREVTKPFEMSDFYKYSTKYRKGTEQNAASTHVENTNGNTAGGYIHRSQDENKNIVSEPVYMDPKFLKNITQCHYRPAMVASDENENLEIRNQ